MLGLSLLKHVHFEVIHDGMMLLWVVLFVGQHCSKKMRWKVKEVAFLTYSKLERIKVKKYVVKEYYVLCKAVVKIEWFWTRFTTCLCSVRVVSGCLLWVLIFWFFIFIFFGGFQKKSCQIWSGGVFYNPSCPNLTQNSIMYLLIEMINELASINPFQISHRIKVKHSLFTPAPKDSLSLSLATYTLLSFFKKIVQWALHLTMHYVSSLVCFIIQ